MTVIENRGAYIYINYDEPYELKNAINLLKEAAKTCAAEKCSSLLLSFVDMPGKVKTLDRFELGVQGAKLLHHLHRIAVVYRREEMNWFLETVAVNRGLNIRLFDNSKAAIKWLVANRVD